MRARRKPAHPIQQDPALNLLAKLLGRAGARGPDVGAHDVGAHVTGTIDRALAVAGLARHAGPVVNVRATIDRALTQAGLVRPVGSTMPQARAASRAAAADATATPASAGEWVARSFSN